MELLPVKSSHIAAIGYDLELRLLRVQYVDGSLYDCVNVNPLIHAALMDSKSKGTFLLDSGLAKRAVRLDDSLQPLRIPDQEPAKPLDTVHQDACCTRWLVGALRRGVATDPWECPKCGCEWRSAPTGPVRHWSPHCPILVLRERR